MISVVVIDNDSTYRAAVAEAVASVSDLQLVGLASTVVDGLQLVAALLPDVVVVDVRMPDGGGPRLARELTARHPDCKVVAISVQTDREIVEEMRAAGAVSYVAKDSSVETLFEALRSAGAR